MHGPISPRQRSDLESQIGRALIHFEKEYMGRGPLETKTWIFEDVILVRLKGVLTPAEQKLSELQRDRSSYLLKQVRNELLASGRALLETVVRDIVGIDVQSIHTDISTKTGERIIVITLQQKLPFDRKGSEDVESEESPTVVTEDAGSDPQFNGQGDVRCKSRRRTKLT